MKLNSEIKVAILIFAAASIVALGGVHLGVAGMIIIFFGFVVLPGYLLVKLLSPTDDLPSIYPASFAAGVSLFAIIGLGLFYFKAPINMIPAFIIPITSALLFSVIYYKNDTKIFKIIERGPIALWICVVIYWAISCALGSFRGWGEDWDYYTYITMVLRIAHRGIAENIPLSYPNENPDPVHSYNSWALMWAYLSRTSGLDPVKLYLRAIIVTAPAALLSFYSMAREIRKDTALPATLAWMAFNLFGMGMIFTGQSSFNNDDPAWLILFPIFFMYALRLIKSGGARSYIMTAILLAGIFIVHPLWGALALISLFVIYISYIYSEGIFDRYSRLAAMAACFFILITIFLSLSFYIAGKQASFSAPNNNLLILLMILPPIALLTPSFLGAIKHKYREPIFRRATSLLVMGIACALPFVLLRLGTAGGARPEVGFETSPYKYFVTGRLFILDPGVFSFTAPDMTLFPLCILGIAALPLLAQGYAKDRIGAIILIVGMTIIPIVALHPAGAYLFSKLTHVAYLRRALRLSAIFAAIGGGVTIGAIAGLFPHRNRTVLACTISVLSIIFYLWPYSPEYFRRAAGKMIFTLANAPSRGLFWSPDYDNYLKAHPAWDTEKFSALLDKVGDGETVFSDQFTSYRLTAYRDVWVVCRFKPSTGAADQSQREADQARFFDPQSDVRTMCSVLSKYGSYWVLINSDPDYRVRDYYLGDPWIVEKMRTSTDYFEESGADGDWVLFRANASCVADGNIRR